LVVVWEDYRLGNWDIFANVLSSQGKLLWGNDGAAVSSLPMTQYNPQVIGCKDGGLIIAWEDYRNGKQYEIFMQKLNSQGTALWGETGTRVKTFNGARAPRLLALPKGQAFVVSWEDYTNGGKAIFGQKYNLD